jgi:membrane-associated protease RseP (regulator of RpoE activity)
MNAYRKLPLTLSGLALGVIAAIVTIFGTGRVLVSGPSNARDYFGDETYDVDGRFVAFVVVVGILIAIAIGLPYLWARLTGIGLTAFLAICLAFAVVAARGNDELFAANYDVSLKSGGVILVIAFLLAAAGVTLALVGSRELGADRYGPPAPPPSTTGSSGWAVASLVLGIGSLLTFFTGALAVAFAALAFAEIRHSPGRSGRGLAVAGLVLGIVVLSLYGLVLLLCAFFTGPS